jgi:lipopolysaccharide assembly protein A
MKTKTIVSLFFILLIVIFSIQNSEVTDVDFLFWKISVSLILIILGSFSFGVLVGILVSLTRKNNTTKDQKTEV